jgi:hypothetical protein
MRAGQGQAARSFSAKPLRLADAELKSILETVWELPYREIAQELTDRKIPAPRGGAWNAMLVMQRDEAIG